MKNALVLFWKKATGGPKQAVLGLVLLSLLLGTRPVRAQGATPVTVTDDQVNAIARQLYCPVCENIPLDVCPTKACADWREEIRLKLSEGWSEAQIKQYFVDRFGDRVLGVPPARGVNWLVYVIPPLAMLLGIFLLYRAFKSWRKAAVSAPNPAPQADLLQDEYVKKLEAQLKQKDQ